MGATVRQRNGKWWVYLYHQGKEVARCIGDDKALAEEVAEKLEASLVQRKHGKVLPEPSDHLDRWFAEHAAQRLGLGDGRAAAPERERRPFASYWNQWLATYVREHCKPSTAAGYELAGRLYLKPYFGDRDLTEIRREDVRRLAYELLAGKVPLLPEPAEDDAAERRRRPRAGVKSRPYVKGTLAPLCALFNQAIEDDHYAGANPALRILRRTRTEDSARRDKATALTGEDLARLLTAAAHFPDWSPFVLLLALTGLRLGEAVALQWGDLDLETRRADIRRNIVDGKVTTPKSGKSRRVDLSARLAAALRAHQARRAATALEAGTGELVPWLFAGASGKPIDPDNFRKRVWPKILTKAKLPTMRIHDLRHTFASLLIQQGESLAYVQAQLGHHSISVTVDTYGHLVPGGNRAAVDRLDALLEGRRPDQDRTERTARPAARRAGRLSRRTSKWSRWELNPRPLECDSSALPTELRPRKSFAGPNAFAAGPQASGGGD